ncbi:MAG TPA: alkaline phosphatase family protein [Candidatus Acidoferrum sp.]|nr:alkaline phosphatase family protein [Candidatus Acidoferrum sp.]
MNRKIILLGVDGATWKIIAPIISAGGLQNFKKLLADGASGILHSTIPAESPPAWTSMFTGVNPGKHGIVDFQFKENGKFVPCLSRYRMAPTIWKIISDSGRRCIIINDPIGYPPETINGIMTSGLMTPPGANDWITPKDRKQEFDTVARGYECDIPTNFAAILSENRDAALDILKRLTTKIIRVGTYAAYHLDWDVLAIIITVTDRLQHFWWNDKQKIAELYERIDQLLGELIQRANELSADLVVVSDHGFGPCDKLISINGTLEKLGFAIRTESRLSKMFNKIGITKDRFRKIMGSWPSTFTALPSFMQNAILKYVPESDQNIKGLDQSKSQAYARTPVGIFIRDQNSKETIAKKLCELTDETTGKLIIEKVLDRNEVLHGDYSYRAPDLFLEPQPGYGFSIDKTGSVERGLVGTHRPEGIFIFYRPKATPQTLPNVPIHPWDIAATLLQLLNIPVPPHFDGRPIINDTQ